MKRNYKYIVLTVILFILATTSVFGVAVKDVADMVGIFRDVFVPANTQVNGSAIAIFGDVDMEGSISGDAVAIFGDVKVDGKVGGSAIAIFGSIHLTNKADVSVDAVQILGGKMEEEAGSYVGGQKLSIASFGISGISGMSILLLIILSITLGKIIIAYIFSVIAVLLFPDQFDRMAREVSINMERKLVIGLLLTIGFYVLGAIMFMVIIGIPFFILLIPLMTLLGFAGNTAVKLAIGKKIGASRTQPWSQMMELFIGTLVYGLIEITMIGKVAIFLGKSIGIGTVIDTKFGKQGMNVETRVGFLSKEDLEKR
ncbi:MAG: hypothetical protein ACOYVK_13730 [Bacillota bacterium]